MIDPCLLALLPLLPVPLLAGPPNILLMAVDNLGWDDVSWHNPSIIMPNLGTLARYATNCNIADSCCGIKTDDQLPHKK